MKEVKVSLNTIEKVKEFARLITNYESDCDLKSGSYVIDAKSIMGIFSLDLSKELTLSIHESNPDLTPISKFIV